MASPRPPKDDPGPPDRITQGGGSTSSTDKLNDVYQRLGSVQSSITYLEGSADDAKKELKLIGERLSQAQGSFNTLKWVLGIAGTLLVLLWGFIAGIVTLAVKHYLRW